MACPCILHRIIHNYNLPLDYILLVCQTYDIDPDWVYRIKDKLTLFDHPEYTLERIEKFNLIRQYAVLFFEKINHSLKFIFRADASIQEGVGHVLRSLGIIEELISQNYSVYFIGKVLDVPWVIEKIHSLGFTKIFSEESEYESNNNSDILILDSYKHKIESSFINLHNCKNIIHR